MKRFFALAMVVVLSAWASLLESLLGNGGSRKCSKAFATNGNRSDRLREQAVIDLHRQEIDQKTVLLSGKCGSQATCAVRWMR